MKNLILGIAAAFTMTSCATIISGSKQNVKISSTPTEAVVIIDSVEVGKTPFKTKLKRKHEHTVRLELDGFQPYEITLKRKFNGWIIANAFVGGIIGVVVDLATGSFYYLSPKEINAELQSGTVLKKEKGSDIYVGVTMTPNPEWTPAGTLSKI